MRSFAFFIFPRHSMLLKSLFGFSLIEVVVSLLLVSFILLGFDAAEVYAVRSIRAGQYFAIATDQLNNMVERLHILNHAEGLDQQIDIWNSQNKLVLPNGWGEIIDHYPLYKISIYWGNTISSCQQVQLGLSGCITEVITL